MITEQTNWERTAAGVFETSIAIASLLAIAAPACIIGWQSYHWLRFGAWPDLPLSAFVAWLRLPSPHAEWVGVQRAIDWLMACPCSVVSLFVGLGVMGVGTYVSERLYEIGKRPQ